MRTASRGSAVWERRMPKGSHLRCACRRIVHKRKVLSAATESHTDGRVAHGSSNFGAHPFRKRARLGRQALHRARYLCRDWCDMDADRAWWEKITHYVGRPGRPTVVFSSVLVSIAAARGPHGGRRGPHGSGCRSRSAFTLSAPSSPPAVGCSTVILFRGHPMSSASRSIPPCSLRHCT